MSDEPGVNNRELPRRWAVAVLCGVVAWCAGGEPFAPAADEASDDERFVAGLCERQLFDLAESYCRQRLDERQLPADERGRLYVELIRTYARHAVNAAREQREPLWQAARQTAQEALREEPDNPRLLLIRTQDALTLLARGEIDRREAEAQGGDFDAALSSIRQAARQFEQLETDVEREVPQRRRAAGRGELTAEELVSLLQHVRYHLARALGERALCYPAGSDDRVAALSAAVEKLKQPLTQLAADAALTWQVKLEQARCLRLLGEAEPAARLLAGLRDESAPAAIRLEALAELIRLLIDAQRLDDALRLAGQGSELPGAGSPQLDLAILEALAARWKVARAGSDQADADRWRGQCVNWADRIEQQRGRYWGWRADRLLVEAAGGSQGAADVRILQRQARNLYLQGSLAEAVAAYDQAAGAAAADPALRYELRFKAALIERQRDRNAEYLGRLRALAREDPGFDQAAEAHYLAIAAAVEEARRDSQQLELYEQLLREHLELWPSSARADTLRMWLGRLLESRRQWVEAASAYLGVSSRSESGGPAFRAAEACWSRELDSRREADQPLETVARQAAEQFEALLPAAADTPWTDGARQAATAAARLRVVYTSDGYSRAEQVLLAAMQTAVDADAAWRAHAASLLVVALAGQPNRRSEALQVLRKSAAADPHQLLETLRQLQSLAAAGRGPALKELAELQLACGELLAPHRGDLSAAEQLGLDLIQAQALADAGRRPEARRRFAELAAQHPRDGAAQHAYATWLLGEDDRESWQSALDRWRLLAQHSKPASDHWYRAKYSVALAQFKLGQKREAARLIRYVEATAGYRDPAWQARYEALLARCQ